MVKRVTAVVLVMAIFLGLSGSVYAQEKKPDAPLRSRRDRLLQVSDGAGEREC